MDEAFRIHGSRSSNGEFMIFLGAGRASNLGIEAEPAYLRYAAEFVRKVSLASPDREISCKISDQTRF